MLLTTHNFPRQLAINEPDGSHVYNVATHDPHSDQVTHPTLTCLISNKFNFFAEGSNTMEKQIHSSIYSTRGKYSLHYRFQLGMAIIAISIDYHS